MAANDVTATQRRIYAGIATRGRERRIGAEVEVGRVARRSAAGGLIGLMTVGSLALWTAVPLAGFRLAALFAPASNPAAGQALVAVLTVPLAMALWAKGLGRLEYLYQRVTSSEPNVLVPPWRRSVSDASTAAPSSVLDRIMIGTVLVAAVALTAWFFLAAGSSLPA